MDALKICQQLVDILVLKFPNLQIQFFNFNLDDTNIW
jgi:hypothetical protein